jgi:molybdopterin synthase catalytic subunit
MSLGISAHSPERTLTPEQLRLHCRLLSPGVPTSATKLAASLGCPETGAVVTFEGLVREAEADRLLTGINYEFHPIMAETELRHLCMQALEQFEIQQIACEHRTGYVAVQQPSIAIAIAARHRAHAFEACQFVLNLLKKSVPSWKTPLYNDEYLNATMNVTP